MRTAMVRRRGFAEIGGFSIGSECMRRESRRGRPDERGRPNPRTAVRARRLMWVVVPPRLGPLALPFGSTRLARAGFGGLEERTYPGKVRALRKPRREELRVVAGGRFVAGA